MTNNQKCKRCGSLIPAGTPMGECPGCLLQAGLNPNPGGYGPNNPPHDRAELAKLFPTLEIGEFIGRGGMGAVYKAVQRSLGRPVALKILSSEVAADPAFAERFNREAQALARLSHPNIVGVHESGRAGDLYYFIMEYVDGINLRQTMQVGSLSPESAMAIVPQICDALQYAHDQGVVHRDVKPENILLDTQGRVKMADFGLAKLFGSAQPDMTLTGEQQTMGTYHYIAPEQLRSAKDVDHRADIYSLGVVFYEMLTGQIPMGHFPPPSQKVQVDVKLDQVVLRAMEQEREQRYQRVSDFKSGVENHTSTDMPPAPRRAVSGTKSLSALAVVGILGIPLGILAGSFTAVWSNHSFGVMVGILVSLIGIIMSGISWASINANPDRLYGLRLAKAGTLLPFTILGLALMVMPLWIIVGEPGGDDGPKSIIGFVFSGLGLVLFFCTMHTIFKRPQGGEKSSWGKILLIILLVLMGLFFLGMIPAYFLLAHAPQPPVTEGTNTTFTETQRHGPNDIGDMHKTIKGYVDRLDFLGKSATRNELVAMVDPGARDGLLSFSAEEFARRGTDGFLGLIGIDVTSLPVPLRQFELILLLTKNGSQRDFLLRTEGMEIRFPVHRVDGKWFLKVGALHRIQDRTVIEAAKDKRNLKAQVELQGQLEKYLQTLDEVQKSGKMNRAQAMILPADLAWIKKQGHLDSSLEARQNRDGLMALNVQELPVPLTSFVVDRIRISGDKATVTIRHAKWRITFPMARHNAKWYLSLGKLEMKKGTAEESGDKDK